ncbi:hypothetical protein HHK36_009522 [Tetracentron sinense]|uniref:Uncharacterized protein n=1 Tax=Tetracentron sinense TaxID=13715 RepID=A0A834ZB14_TETSI|nr:hypothetical protein HHK36_009522 [Tetracentron sinense]
MPLCSYFPSDSTKISKMEFHIMKRKDLQGRNSSRGREICMFSTAAAIEEPINPPVEVNYTQLLINGKFVDAGDVIGHVAEDRAGDINRAISTTRKTFDEGLRPKMNVNILILILFHSMT